MPISNHLDDLRRSGGNVKRRPGLANCCLVYGSAGVLVVCGLSVAGAELLFHGFNRSLGGCALATGLLLVATGIVAIAVQGRQAVGMACRIAVPLLCLASLPACIATACLAFTASGSISQLPWCEDIRLPQNSNSTQLNSTSSSSSSSAAAAAAASSRVPEQEQASDAIKKSVIDVNQSSVIFWSRLCLTAVLCVSASLSVLLMSASLSRIYRIVKASSSRRRHIRPSSLKHVDPVVLADGKKFASGTALSSSSLATGMNGDSTGSNLLH